MTATDQIIYMDYAAATPVDPEVVKAMQPYWSDKFYNPSASYLCAKSVAKDLLAARQTVAKWLGCQAPEITFTAGGTEANNLAIQGVMRAFPEANVIYSAIEHDSVIEPAKLFDSRVAPVDAKGRVDLQALYDLIDDQTVLISIMFANNEIGTIQPLTDVAKLISEVKAERARNGNQLPLYLHTDACQAAVYMDVHVHRIGVDMMTINGGKIYGPKQSGVLYIKSGTVIDPLILGGGQEKGLRSGTENVAAAVGLSAAFDFVQGRKYQESKRLGELQSYLIQELSAKHPEAVINGDTTKRLCNNIHVTFPGVDNERLMMELDERGIICAVGSACSASDDEPSHVLKAIGLTDEQAQSSLRFSLGQSTTKIEIDKVLSVLSTLLP